MTRRGLFEWVQGRAVQVLEERVEEELVVLGRADDRAGDGRGAR